MKVRMYQVDAFTSKLFGGNPAAICVLEEHLPEDIMQNIAAENNLAETAFIIETITGYEIRWFTPTIEVELCGHATLAAAHVIFNHLDFEEDVISFSTIFRGNLSVSRTGDLLSLDFPADTITRVDTPPLLIVALGVEPMETWIGQTDYMAVLPSEKHIIDLNPNMDILGSFAVRGIIVTAQGTETDFVSRFFGPRSGINEDPVTGSAHTSLTPYWAAELKKDSLTAAQLSARKGLLWCSHRGDRVEISGYAVTYMTAEIEVPNNHG